MRLKIKAGDLKEGYVTLAVEVIDKKRKFEAVRKYINLRLGVGLGPTKVYDEILPETVKSEGAAPKRLLDFNVGRGPTSLAIGDEIELISNVEFIDNGLNL